MTYYVDGHILRPSPPACGCGCPDFRPVHRYENDQGIGPAWECVDCGGIYDGI
ncbi:hypothetical protein [Streptomyces sp. BH055]|uniref:hypothetical protein n=1 Tax=unclassified Streptomyces TaxID=2593676 RepID=UPI003BB6F2F7